MKHFEFNGSMVSMQFMALVAGALIMFTSCQKETLVTPQKTEVSDFNIELATVDLIYGNAYGLSSAAVLSQYAALIDGLTPDQLETLHHMAKVNFENNAAKDGQEIGLRGAYGSTLSPGDMSVSFGRDVDRSGNTVVVGSLGKVYVFEGGALVAEFTSDTEFTSGFGNEVSISGNRFVAMGSVIDFPNYYGGEVRTYVKKAGKWTLDGVIIVDDMLYLEDIAMDGNTFAISGREVVNPADILIKIYGAHGNSGWQLEQSIVHANKFYWDLDIKGNILAANGGDAGIGGFLNPKAYIFEYQDGSWSETAEVPFVGGFISRHIAIGNDSYIVANTGSPSVVYELTSSDGSWAITDQYPAAGTSFDRAIAAQGERIAVSGGGFADPVVYTFNSGSEGDVYGPGTGGFGVSLYVHGNETGIGHTTSPEGVVYLMD